MRTAGIDSTALFFIYFFSCLNSHLEVSLLTACFNVSGWRFHRSTTLTASEYFPVSVLALLGHEWQLLVFSVLPRC
jgi:hypothetical protein